MKKNYVEELQWRGMIQNIMPGTKELFDNNTVTAYVGIDPTADSLHIGHLVSIMMLKHLQINGHRPILLLGGATGMIGDPSMKSNERNLLDEKTLRHNQEAIGKQLSRFLDFDSTKPNAAELVNNYDWTKDYTFLHFIRDIGKHMTVNYMMAKDSVKKRLTGELNEGMSFTEFSYQLLQAWDFYYLYQTKNCKLQMGGSDQWGNITSGVELIRRKAGGDGYGLVCPLITKADGGKFGKTEEGNVWLDKKYTSPYKFYQFWINTSDNDAEKYIKIFTLIDEKTINTIIDKHRKEPHLRLLQTTLAENVTEMIHGKSELENAKKASSLLFSNANKDILKEIDEDTFLSVFDGVEQFEVDNQEFIKGITVISLLSEKTAIFESKGELRRLVQGGGLSINREKTSNPDQTITTADLLNNKYILVQKGKKHYSIIKCK